MDKLDELALSQLVFPVVKEYVLPKLKNIFSDPEVAETAKVSFENYLLKRYEKFLIIDTLVFPNQQTQLKTLYEPLTVETVENRKEVSILIDSYPQDFLTKFVRVLIEDTAGMGKSTISKILFISAIEDNVGIPILIELRHINENNSFLKEILSQLSDANVKLEMSDIEEMINRGNFIFILDGYDEISRKDKEFVQRDLARFIDKGSENYFLITSRYEDSLVSLGDFQKFSIRPLSSKEAYSLIKRYDQFSYKPISEELISKLQTQEYEEVLSDFLSNPFLVSLLYKSFDFKKDIPQKKTQFYRQVYDALFDAHDLSKGGYYKRDKHSKLQSDDFDRVLRYIAFLTSTENEVEYSRDHIIQVIKKAQAYIPDLEFRPSDFLQDLLETVPLFKREGINVKWAHKSLQDYFSAKFIWIDSGSKQLNILAKIFSDPSVFRFYNTLDIFFDLDPKVFEQTILYWFLERFESLYHDFKQKFPNITDEDLKNRVRKIFLNEYTGFVLYRNENFTNDDQETELIEEDSILDKALSEVHDDFLLDLDIDTIRVFDTIDPNQKVFSFSKPNTNMTTIGRLLRKKVGILSSHDPQPEGTLGLPKVDVGTLQEVTTDIGDPLNSEEAFNLTTQFIEKDMVIDFELAMQKLKDLRRIKEKDNSDELLDW